MICSLGRSYIGKNSFTLAYLGLNDQFSIAPVEQCILQRDKR